MFEDLVRTMFVSHVTATYIFTADVFDVFIIGDYNVQLFEKPECVLGDVTSCAGGRRRDRCDGVGRVRRDVSGDASRDANGRRRQGGRAVAAESEGGRGDGLESTTSGVWRGPV